MGRLRADAVLAIAASLAMVGCAGDRRPAPHFWGETPTSTERDHADLRTVTSAEWTLARQRLDELRTTIPTTPYVQRVRVTLVEPASGMRFEARGAVAVLPGRAVRMMLLGPGGTTAVDLWVTPDRYRFVVPAADLAKRGTRPSDDARGLPVAFFRWWFLSPLGGRLLSAHASATESSWLLAAPSATVLVRARSAGLVARRREGTREEWIVWKGRGLAPEAGATARYAMTGGVRVEVEVEGVEAGPPPEEAFVDPDGDRLDPSSSDPSKREMHP